MIDAWGERFASYVLLGLNDNLKHFFTEQLDFCLAVSFNMPKPSAVRTQMGEAVYQLKYCSDDLTREQIQKYKIVLFNGILEAFDDLPLLSKDTIVSAIPANSEGQKKIAWKLAKATAEKKDCEFLSPTLKCSKRSLKNLPFEEKMREWRVIFSSGGCIDLSTNVSGKTVVVVDDLYQSGVTMWYFADYLKSQGAKCVIGLVCVKSLRDTDNL